MWAQSGSSYAWSPSSKLWLQFWRLTSALPCCSPLPFAHPLCRWRNHFRGVPIMVDTVRTADQLCKDV